MANGAAVAAIVSEPLLRLLFKQAPGFIALVQEPAHTFVLVNDAFQQLIGPRDIIGKAAREALPDIEGHACFDLLDSVYASGEPHVAHEMRLRLRPTPDAAWIERYVDFVYQPVRGPNGKSAGIFIQGNDVTQRVVAQRRVAREVEARDAQRRRFDTVLSSIEDFAYTFDRELRFTYVNRPLLALWGLALEEAIGKRFSELDYEPALAARLEAELGAVFEAGKQFRGESFYRGASGQEGWYEYIFNPVFAADGAVEAVAGSSRNITARLERQRQLAALIESERAAKHDAQRANQLKDEFLATLSHELRTPLNAILGWSELLRGGRVAPEKIAEAAERISRNARAQARLISDLLDMNGIVSGKVRLSIEKRVALAKPLEAAIEAVRLDAARREIHLSGPGPAAEVQLDCDPDRLQQVFWNLLVNAIKFTPRGGRVSTQIDFSGHDVIVKVSDTGVGLEPEFLPHVFERFAQADSSSTRKHGGLGLGLSISQSLVTMHGGQIRAESAGVGHGTTFIVSLPLRQQEADEGPASSWGELSDEVLPPVEQAPALRAAQVLVVDDDAESRDLVAHALEQYGAAVETASSAIEALQQIARKPPALLVCDIGMPEIDGYELLHRVRQFSAVPAIAFSALVRPEDKAQAMARGFAALISKPAEPALIISVCSEVLAHREGTRDPG